MSRLAYFDLVGGASGDMILAALLDLGLDIDELRAAIAGLGLDGVTLHEETATRNGFAARRFRVALAEGERRHRHLADIEALIRDADQLSAAVRERASAIFRRLARAEARVHGCSVEEVHFHEVGADDALVDIVGAAFAIERLGFDALLCSSVPLGSGFVTCEHGEVPLPAPAVLALLTEVSAPIRSLAEGPERVTPTAAAILAELARFGPIPSGALTRVGIGAGGREANPDGSPNILRCLVLEQETDSSADERVLVFEANIDDQSPEELAVAMERVLAVGALDASLAPIFMKKGRPGQALQVLARVEDGPAVEAAIFRHTTTFGLRRSQVERRVLARRVITVGTPFGPVRVKLGEQAGVVLRASPELEDCRARASAAGVSLSEVFAAARAGLEPSPDAAADDVLAE